MFVSPESGLVFFGVILVTAGILTSFDVAAKGGTKNVGDVTINSFSIYNNDSSSEYDIQLSFSQSGAQDEIKSWQLTVGSQYFCDDTDLDNENGTFTFNRYSATDREGSESNTTWEDIMTQAAGSYTVKVKIFSKKKCANEDQDEDEEDYTISTDPNPGVNDPPVANDDTASTVTDTTLYSSTSILSNDTDPEGDSLSVSSGTFTTSQSGTLVLQSDGDYTYSPPSGFSGTDTYDYTLSDSALTDTGTITFNVSSSCSGTCAILSITQDNTDNSSPFKNSLTYTRSGNIGDHTHHITYYYGTAANNLSNSYTGAEPKLHENNGTYSRTFDTSDLGGLDLPAGTYYAKVELRGESNLSPHATSPIITFTVVDPNANNPPAITGDLAVSVAEGGTVYLTSSDLNYSDVDSDDSASDGTVKYFVSANASNGTLETYSNGGGWEAFTTSTTSGRWANKTTQEGPDGSGTTRMRYTHDGSETTSASFQIYVEDGNEDSSTPTSSTVNITVSAVNDVPVLSDAGATLAYTEGDAATVIDSSLTITDVDDTNIEGATITISGGYQSSEDVLALGNTGLGISVASNSSGVLTLTGSTTEANYEIALESVTYFNSNTNNPNNSNRTITWVVSDGTANSSGVTSTITVADTNDAPVLSDAGATLAYTEGDSATAIDSSLTITDGDDTNIEGATITISSGYQTSEDVLALGNTGLGISVASNSSGVLTLTGS
ncbi:MAG: Ig-like domain-containing protein, partial [Pseudomonadales bacterium]|nr:Ig-like domain-containing protein [Pseudomonadales bacterium]